MKRAVALVALLGFTTAALAAPELGKPAPEFEAKDIHGKAHKLSDYKGKIVVLESYNLDCPFVVNQYKGGAMQELQKEVTDKGGVWLVVNSVEPKHSNARTPERAREEWKAQKMNATAWLDDNAGTIGRAYEMRTTPQMYIIDKEGKLIYNGAIDDKPTNSHDPRAAKNYVREIFGKLAAGEKVEPTSNKSYGCSVKYAK